MAYYLGRRAQGDLILFHATQTPTKESHGTRFVSVIGPFKSRVGASYFARYGRDDPRIRTADDAERLARADPRMEQTIVEEAMSEEELAIAHECEAFDHLENFQVNSPIPIQIPNQGAIPCLIGLKTN
ncbi:MAG TPA: hypothetical protein PLN86_15590 [Candidatus Hydrogenedentes bacterium]|nr:hypothetical protein [Candidatus Hydrogenedentota bacterium]